TFTTPELKILTTETHKFWVMDQLSANADFGNGRLTLIDGIRVDFEDGWGLIRPSNTSPVLSLRFEADTQEALDRIQDEFQAQLANIDDTLKFR
ncbi:phosphomannomutase/phosphoglucomutase, partial [Pseudomonadales bacterium]|nr:phosphomannomutase/phosphoglucomutase [Pseudomonadales bacterium]